MIFTPQPGQFYFVVNIGSVATKFPESGTVPLRSLIFHLMRLCMAVSFLIFVHYVT